MPMFDAIPYGSHRTSFGGFQNTCFTLVEIATELDINRAYFNASVLALSGGRLTAVDAAAYRAAAHKAGMITIEWHHPPWPTGRRAGPNR